MSYSGEETSRASGSPIEVYDIVLGSEEWHLTSSEEPVTISMVDYTPLALKREGIPISKDDRTTEANLALPFDHDFVQRYILIVPSEKAYVTIRRFHRYDVGPAVISLFKGVVNAVRFSSDGLIAFVGIAPFSDNLGLNIPRYNYSSLCNHVLGDRTCRIDLENDSSPTLMLPYKFVGNFSAINGVVVTVDGIAAAGYPDHFFNSGMFKTIAGDKRCIKKQVGDIIHLLVPPFEGSGLLGQDVTIYAGCDHKISTCQNTFDNVINFGGFPTVPAKNPFTQQIFGR